MTNQSHQLAAIMFTDIVGYTKLMGTDEHKALELLRNNRNLHKSIIKKHHGKWLKEMGDGTLASFKSTSDAVYCAGELMKACEKEEISLRIGLHQGEIVEVDDDIFGDGVNVASRLETRARPGQILASGPVNRNIKNKPGITSSFIQEAELKNVDDSIAIYSIAIDNNYKDSYSHENLTTHSTALDNSIAVLPFVNMSNDPEQEFFCDGISEEIINTIVQYPDLKIAGRTSSFSFKNKNKDLREIGKALGVSKILEGSIRKSGNNIRVTAQLIESSNGFHLWSKKYDRKLDDVFLIQDEIAQDIGNQLKLSLYSESSKPISRKHTNSIDAYQLYFKGRAFYFERGQSLYKAESCFKEALEIDPEYALASSALADTYIMFIWHGHLSPVDTWPKAISFAQHALKNGSELSEVHNTWAIISLLYENNRDIAKKAFEKALDLNPGYTQARCWYGLFDLTHINKKFDEGIKQTKLAIDKDPLSHYAYAVHALALTRSKNFEEAITAAKYGVKLNPKALVGRYALGNSYLWSNNLQKAINEFETGLEISKEHSWCTYLLIICYVRIDQKEKAQQLYEMLKRKEEKAYLQPTVMFMSAAILGKEQEAIYYANQAIEIKDPFIYYVINSNDLDIVKSLPNLNDILKHLDYVEEKQ